jgi:CHAD domain-containing protein
VSPGFDDEHIHKMRTTVKKMRALSRWMGIPPQVMKGYVRKVYRAAGKIRDAQLLLKSIATEDNVPPPFRTWLEARLEEMKMEWSRIYDEKK